jgi:hypothetical protein
LFSVAEINPHKSKEVFGVDSSTTGVSSAGVTSTEVLHHVKTKDHAANTATSGKTFFITKNK